MTAEWMLTDEEIEDIENEYPRQYGIGITTAKAQAKKLLEYLIAKHQAFIDEATDETQKITHRHTLWFLEEMLKQLEAK